MALYAFDGTWNVRDSNEALHVIQAPQYGVNTAARRDTVETNVHRFTEFYGEGKFEYLQGVGTRFGVVGRALGGAFGLGGRHRIRRMYRNLTKRYFNGDSEIDIVGFSRGAALAVHFANVIARYGLRNPSNRKHLAWWYYPELGWTFRHPKRGPEDVSDPEIHFLGLWDTVATFGIPVWPFRNRGKKWMVWNVPANVDRTFHAMALDEVRATFALVRPTAPEQGKIYEVWFRGVHSNIGGGYVDRGLSDIALAWMMEQAIWTWRKQKRKLPKLFLEALKQLGPEPDLAPDWEGINVESLEPDPNGIIARPRRLRGEAWRELPAGALIHHTVRLRTKNLITDHQASNRQLLRHIPKSCLTVYDPPLFYGGTLREIAREFAREAFSRVPVRPEPWLRVEEWYVIRSDDWIALSTKLGRSDPDGPVKKARRADFVEVAAAWFLHGMPVDAEHLFDSEGGDIRLDNQDLKEEASWFVPALASLQPHLRWDGQIFSSLLSARLKS